MFKNVAGQKVQLFAFDTTTGAPKTGDAANITAYVSKDHGTVTVLTDTGAAEMDATNAKGVYLFDVAQAESNADEATFTAKSTTANVSITPRFVTTFPTTGILAPATAGRTLVVDAAGLADANTVKLGPTGSGVAQTARDVGASVLLSSGTGTGQVSLTSGAVKIQSTLKIGQALPDFGFTMTDSTNHLPVTTSPGITSSRSINGAAFASCTNSAAELDAGSGHYVIDLSASDMGGASVVLRFSATACDTLEVQLFLEP
jgi:dihydroxyacetone kinase DhaKLM complex PTS-EIIA-like component DhaM